MNEIIRIHIAKTPYDIEVAAKKQLDEYLSSLEKYSADKELMLDIEIRMVELLGERGVLANGVISADDVKAMREQLGEPHEFVEDDATGGSVPAEESARPKLYRDLEGALLGGVFSGLANYTGVSAIWMRLGFVVLLAISFGFAAFIYALFWIIIPPARSVAERLQSVGKSVTLSSMKQLNDSEVQARKTSMPILQRIFMIVIGVGSILAALATTIAMVVAIVISFTNNSLSKLSEDIIGMAYENQALVWFLYWLAIFGVVMLIALFVISAYAFLARKFNKPVLIAASIVIVLGLIAATTVASVTARESLRIREEIQSSVQETNIDLPESFGKVSNLVVVDESKSSDENAGWSTSSVQYVVSDREPRYTLVGLPEVKVKVTTDGSTAYVSMTNASLPLSSIVGSRLTIYGPALESLKLDTSVSMSYTSNEQSDLEIMGSRDSNLSVSGGYESIKVGGDGYVDLSSSAVESLSIDAGSHFGLSAGTVRQLSVNAPDSCADSRYGDLPVRVTVNGVSSGVITYNGVEGKADTKRTDCAEIIVGTDEDDDYYREFEY